MGARLTLTCDRCGATSEVKVEPRDVTRWGDETVAGMVRGAGWDFSLSRVTDRYEYMCPGCNVAFEAMLGRQAEETRALMARHNAEFNAFMSPVSPTVVDE